MTNANLDYFSLSTLICLNLVIDRRWLRLRCSGRKAISGSGTGSGRKLQPDAKPGILNVDPKGPNFFVVFFCENVTSFDNFLMFTLLYSL